jgi:hypothetical protein
MPDPTAIPWPLMPRWAWYGVPSPNEKTRSALAHVNRRYHWHMGRLRALLVQSSILCHNDSYTEIPLRTTVARAIDKEMRAITFEFNSWKKANGYD